MNEANDVSVPPPRDEQIPAALPDNLRKFLNDQKEFGQKADTLRFEVLQPGDEVTIDVYPTSAHPSPEPLILAILEKKENGTVKAMARGGVAQLQEQPVEFSGSAISPNGTWFRNGLLDINSYLEVGFVDEVRGRETMASVREIFMREGKIGQYDDELFQSLQEDWGPAIEKAKAGGEVAVGIQNYREFSGGRDPDFATREGQADFIEFIEAKRAAYQKLLVGPIADFKVEKPWSPPQASGA